MLLVRRTLVLYLCNLAPESERDLLLDKLLLTSSGLREENDLVLATPETVRLVELVKRVHHGGFDGTVRTFLADYPGDSTEELVKPRTRLMIGAKHCRTRKGQLQLRLLLESRLSWASHRLCLRRRRTRLSLLQWTSLLRSHTSGGGQSGACGRCRTFR